MKKKILIYGAGALGRGFLAPLLQKYDVETSFVDIDKKIISEMKGRKNYKVATITESGYKILDVSIKEAFLLDEEDIKEYDIVFSAVGANNYHGLAGKFKNAKAVISCENDFSSSKILRELSGNSNIYFGIPDVITSSTASSDLLKLDKLATISEKGILIIEKGNYSLPKDIFQSNYKIIKMHWMCKLFIHSAPHAILAYLVSERKLHNLL